MKKTLLLVALAVALVLAFATSAFAIGPFYSSVYENSEFGNVLTGKYLDWDAASAFPGNSGTSPHGGYTANTNKCAVCHSVHTAELGGSVLTAGGPYATYAQGCVFCHAEGNTFTDVVMTANADGYISPHGTCARCHALNPHGVGTSQYTTLASKLINTVPDTFITQDLGTDGDAAIIASFPGFTPSAPATNGLDLTMFDGTGDVVTGGVLGTGYLCGNCHGQTFAVNLPGANPAGGGEFTGHRVTAMASASYNGPAYGASLTGKPVAFANANACSACHDAKTASGDTAFPHGYVDNTGAVSPKTVAGSSYIWLQLGSYLGAADTTLLAGIEPETGGGNANLLTEDGLCLKCHRPAADSGVGFSF